MDNAQEPPTPAPSVKRAKSRARFLQFEVSGTRCPFGYKMTWEIAYVITLSDPKTPVEDTIQIETVENRGYEISDFIETQCPQMWDEIRAAIAAHIGE